MANWGRAFRQDYTEPPLLSEESRAKVAQCSLIQSTEYKTWKDVYLDGNFIGMVRVKVSGDSEYRLSNDSPAMYCGNTSTLNSKDNRHSLAILGLLSHT